MTQNPAVTDREVEVSEGRSIVSATDAQGRITHVNDYFREISGFSDAELIGQPHDVIRHPDMPAAAFADLWSTIKAGRPWVGIVKNRTKNGNQ